MKKIFISACLLCCTCYVSAQNESYRGGIADGYGGDSLVSFSQTTLPLSFSPYRGNISDGYAADSVINFTQYAYINMFSPYRGSNADGASGDSLISFAQRAYITMFQPYASGASDGWAGYPIFGVTIVPVNLLSFTGEQVDKKHVLHWTTSQEENSSHFDVERSADGIHFTKLGTVAAAGNSSTARHYDYTDAIPMQGNNFYRLQMVDLDGASKYSNIILLKLSGNNTMSIYPNPTTNTLNVLLGGAIDHTTISADIFDMSGKYIQGINGKKTNTSFSFDVNRLPAGVYVLRVICNGETSLWRFVKE